MTCDDWRRRQPLEGWLLTDVRCVTVDSPYAEDDVLLNDACV